MTDQDIIIEVAKLDGHLNPTYSMGQWYAGDLSKKVPLYVFNACYLTSRDAIIPVIEKQDEETQFKFVCEMYAETNCEGTNAATLADLKLICATPRQLCTALLKAVGRWKE